MEQTNNNKIIMVLLGVLVVILGGLCILFATGILVLNDKKEETKADGPVTDNGNKGDVLTEDISDLPEWVQYVFSKDITKIEYTKYADEIPDGDYDKCPKVEITKNDLAKIYREMSNHDLVKGRGGLGFAGNCYPEVTAYFKDGYVVSFLSGITILGGEKQDPAFIEALDKSVVKITDTGDENARWFYNFAYFNLGEYVENNILK